MHLLLERKEITLLKLLPFRQKLFYNKKPPLQVVFVRARIMEEKPSKFRVMGLAKKHLRFFWLAVMILLCKSYDVIACASLNLA